MEDKFTEWQLMVRDIITKVFQNYPLPKWIVFVADTVAVFITFWFSYLLRFNYIPTDFPIQDALNQGAAVVVIYILFALYFRPYSGMIRHTTLIDIYFIFVTTTITFLSLFLLTLLARNLNLPYLFQIPLSILTIHYMVISLFLIAERIIIKTLFYLVTISHTKKKNVIIYGAGAMGVIVKRVLLSDVRGDYHVVGFIDNNRVLQGKKLNGIPVYPPKVITREFLFKHGIETMIFAIRDIKPSEKSEIISYALNIGLEVRDTPAVEQWLNGELEIHQIEKVKLEDLLGREPIDLNLDKIGKELRGRTILVTGAAGSIGSEIARQITGFHVKNLILVDQAETPMFHLGNELKTGHLQCPVKTILADITAYKKMESIFVTYQPDIVFHAAAYKHVPLMEEHPHEAIRVNVGGTAVITRLSMKYGVEKFVMISTDKAVNPTNVMGASKRLCEMVVQLKSQHKANNTQFIITRFGNVLGSNGSVIPLFAKQIAEGGPVTVTHPEITRYFMTIPEACQLVLEAGFMGKGGEIYVFDMGKPVKIVDLARQMIRLSGYAPDKEVKIVYTGLRPGEKLYEELLADEETTVPTHHPKIKIAQVKQLEAPGTIMQVEKLLSVLYSLSQHQVIDMLKELVPEYSSATDYVSGPQIAHAG